MKDFIAFLDVRRCKNWARKISSWKYLFEDLFCQIFQSTEYLISDLHSELLLGGVEGQQLQQLII